jgi:hypothetical protein
VDDGVGGVKQYKDVVNIAAVIYNVVFVCQVC